MGCCRHGQYAGKVFCQLNQIVTLLDKHDVKPMPYSLPPELDPIPSQKVTSNLVDLGKFYTSQDSSSMGGVFGMLVGAKLAQPHINCFVFSGDGCWRLFAGAMPEAKDLCIILFFLTLP